MTLRDTELRLSFWRNGSTQAERLAAAALRLAGYEEIDPQSPLGGPDGRKDIICQKGGVVWVCGVYFPNAPVRFPAVKKKFIHDLAGVKSEYGGFVFVSNQSLTPNQRDTLIALAKKSRKEADIIHLQRLQNLLDAAPGYGIRIQYLGIAMTIEEQLSWATDSDTQTAKALGVNTRELMALRAAIDRIGLGQAHIARTIAAAVPSTAATPDLISVSNFTKSDRLGDISAILDPKIILLFHRLTCFDLPSRYIGALRSEDVWLGNAEGRRVDHIQPVRPHDIVPALEALCSEWRRNFSRLKTESDKIEAIAKFHTKILVIHPFFDGNGRVARAILMQQCVDMFGRADMTLMSKGVEYYDALKSADGGQYSKLEAVIRPIIKG